MKNSTTLLPSAKFTAPLFGVLSASLAFFLSGCSLLPEPTKDPTRFYLLSTSASAAAEPLAGAPAIHLRPIELASYLRVRPMIVRRGDNEVEFREYARWGEPLEQGVGRVLREELLAHGASAVQTGVLRGPEITAELAVRILAFEGQADGGVNFRAAWELTSAGATSKMIGHGDFHATGLQWDAKNEATLASQFSKAVTMLADDIAAALPKAK